MFRFFHVCMPRELFIVPVSSKSPLGPNSRAVADASKGWSGSDNPSVDDDTASTPPFHGRGIQLPEASPSGSLHVGDPVVLESLAGSAGLGSAYDVPLTTCHPVSCPQGASAAPSVPCEWPVMAIITPVSIRDGDVREDVKIHVYVAVPEGQEVRQYIYIYISM